MVEQLQVFVVILMSVSAVVRAVDYTGYHECVHNSYEPFCLNTAGQFSRERRSLKEFPSIPSTAACVHLKGNYIEKFPQDVNSLKNVETLDISANRITYLPNDLHKMQKLEILDLSANRIETLSPSTKFPASLRGLILARNNMKYIPNGVTIPGLFVFDLSHNLFEEIPEQFCVSDQLIRVDFSKNPLRHDVSRDVSKINRCKNVNGIPFCLFTTDTTIKCDCSSLGPLLQESPSFCMGADEKYTAFSCSSNSADMYKAKKIFDLNITEVKDECPHAFKSSRVNSSPRNGLHISVILAMSFMFFIPML